MYRREGWYALFALRLKRVPCSCDLHKLTFHHFYRTKQKTLTNHSVTVWCKSFYPSTRKCLVVRQENEGMTTIQYNPFLRIYEAKFMFCVVLFFNICYSSWELGFGSMRFVCLWILNSYSLKSHALINILSFLVIM